LILRYQINKRGGSESSAKSDLLKWVQSKIPEYDIKNFTKDWNDGRAICGLVNALKPGSCPDHRSLDANNALANATRGTDIGESMGVPKIVQPSEMIHPKVDELAMMTYISYFRDLEEKGLLNDDASKCRAYGDGLVEGIVNEEAKFIVETPKKCKGKLEVKVEGPKNKAKVIITDNGDGTYNVSYTPTEPGTWYVHVTMDGKHIPGSIFKVTVLEQESLGGEGKIIVFYTTTTASNEKSRPLQELLEGKKVHLREDFEPWVPVDIMEREDREAVFRRANTRKLPIVFIDDVYIGDYDRVAELNDSGELDRLLKVNETKYIASGLQHLSLKGKSSAPAGPISSKPIGKPSNPPPAQQSQASGAGGKFCANCGTPYQGVAKFCSKCGTPRS